MKSVFSLFVLVVAALTAVRPAYAATGDIGPVYVENVFLVTVASGGHQAGNLEIHIKNGFQAPPPLVCNGNYITTLKSTDADKRMFSLLVVAQVANKPIHLRLTDDPAYTAYGGRCSIVWAMMVP